jgi:hypothetical protein
MQRGFAVGLRLAVASLGMFMLASCGGGGGGGGGTSAPSSNADLSALSVSVGNPAPGFAAATTTYSLTVSSTTTSTTVTATTADSGASVSINGVATASGVASNAIPLTANAVTTIDIVITAANNSTKTYSVQITRSAIVLSSNADLSALNVSAPGTLTPFFAASTISYSLTTASTTATTTVTATTADTGASLTINGVAAMSGVASSVIPLTAGAVTPITIVVTAADSSSKTYSVQITRLPPPNANLSALSLSTGALAPAFVPATLSYTSTLGFLASRVRVLTTTQDNTASVTVNGQPQTATGYEVPLVEGAITNIDVTVTVAGTSPQTYSLAVTRDTLATFQSHLFEQVAASDGKPGDYFGQAVAIHGDTMVIGSPQAAASKSILHEGAAYVFVRDATTGKWSEKQILRPVNAAAFENYGSSVVFDGTSIIVGADFATVATRNCPICGAVYVYSQQPNGDWAESQTLVPTDTITTEFGIKLALAGSTLIVGAADESVFVFNRDNNGTWSQTQKLQASDTRTNNVFGSSIAFDGKHIVIGAFRAVDPIDTVTQIGAAYVFGLDNTGQWIEQNILHDSSPTAYSYFGFSVAVEGDTILVGSPHLTYGAVYLFQPDSITGQWTQQQKLTASSQQSNNYYGNTLAIQGDIFIVGSLWENYTGTVAVTAAGNAHLFSRSNASASWTERSLVRPVPTAAEGSSLYSDALNLQGENLVVGADGMLTNTGWAFTVK